MARERAERSNRRLLVGLGITAIVTYGVGTLVIRWLGAAWSFAIVLSIALAVGSVATNWYRLRS